MYWACPGFPGRPRDCKLFNSLILPQNILNSRELKACGKRHSMTSKALLDIEMTRLPSGPRNAGDDDDIVHDHGVSTVTAKPKLKQPPLYKVVLINDDYTPMDFVVDVLRSFFGMNVEKATQIMLKVHTEGKGVCGVYSKDVAETKAAQVNDYSRECEQPLLCSVEVDR